MAIILNTPLTSYFQILHLNHANQSRQVQPVVTIGLLPHMVINDISDLFEMKNVTNGGNKKQITSGGNKLEQFAILQMEVSTEIANRSRWPSLFQ